jgi:superfamily I DNA/RNA helicase
MFYLHPSQAEIVEHVSTGPMRVQGGPGTGKTVAALHRARHLVRAGQAETVLLTTFVNLLPGVWKNLLRTFVPDVQDAIKTRTVDALALEIVTVADGRPGTILGNASDERRKLLDRVIRKTPGLAAAIGTAANFEREIDQVIAGRVLDLDTYLAVERHGRGTAMRVAERQVVWAGYERYRSALRDQSLVDWATLRVRALEFARDGAGPRFDAVIVDEAQDLTAAQLMLLMELDSSPDHSEFMLVGDGRQAIYPGGYRLGHVGLSARRRPFKLETNWRNTQWIAEAAQAALGDTEFADLETGELTPSSVEQPLPLRLGEPVELHVVTGSRDGAEVMLMLVDDVLQSGALADIGVLGRTKKTLDWAEKTLREAGRAVVRLDDYKGQPVKAIRVGTFAKSKGLEFKLVIIAAAGKDSWAVSPHWLREDSEIDEWWATELRTFYVAMTRARDRLAILSGPDLSPPVERARELLDEQDWR